MAVDFRDYPERQRFELEADGATAISEYRIKDGIITFVHTEVPEALSGRGIASRLIKSALEQVRARGLKVASRCSFVTAYMEKHPEYNDLLV
jgi:predicted GNAT family acetyltransferase